MRTAITLKRTRVVFTFVEASMNVIFSLKCHCARPAAMKIIPRIRRRLLKIDPTTEHRKRETVASSGVGKGTAHQGNDKLTRVVHGGHIALPNKMHPSDHLSANKVFTICQIGTNLLQCNNPNNERDDISDFRASGEAKVMLVARAGNQIEACLQHVAIKEPSDSPTRTIKSPTAQALSLASEMIAKNEANAVI